MFPPIDHRKETTSGTVTLSLDEEAESRDDIRFSFQLSRAQRWQIDLADAIKATFGATCETLEGQMLIQQAVLAGIKEDVIKDLVSRALANFDWEKIIADFLSTNRGQDLLQDYFSSEQGRKVLANAVATGRFGNDQVDGA